MLIEETGRATTARGDQAAIDAFTAAAALGREGASVAALDLTQELADRGAGASPGNAVALTADVTSADEADAAVAMAENEIGPLDILVNSHGIFPTITLLDLTPEKWDNIFAVNVRGNVLDVPGRRTALDQAEQPGLDRKYQAPAPRPPRVPAAPPTAGPKPRST